MPLTPIRKWVLEVKPQGPPGNGGFEAIFSSIISTVGPPFLTFKSLDILRVLEGCWTDHSVIYIRNSPWAACSEGGEVRAGTPVGAIHASASEFGLGFRA